MRALTPDAMTISGAAPAATAAASGVVRAFETVEVHVAAEPVLSAWAELEQLAPCSIYQTRAWLLPWIAALAAPAGLLPRFVLARGADARPVALLCLGLRKRGPLCLARWMGGKDANFNMALVAPSSSWTRRELMRLLRAAARQLGRDAPDLLVLVNQPLDWGGVANPFAKLSRQPSPSAAYAMTLTGDPDRLFAAKLSSDARKKLRKKEAKLAALGPITHVVASTEVERREVLDAFLRLRNARFRAQNIVSPFEAEEMARFIATASESDAPGIELHALKVGPRIVAVYGGAAWQGQWSGMFNAFDMDPTVAAASPGDLLLQRIVAKCCRDGLKRFDLGIGAARYKSALCNEEIALFDVFVPLSPMGRAIKLALAAKQKLKGVVKRDPRLYGLAKRLLGRRG